MEPGGGWGWGHVEESCYNLVTQTEVGVLFGVEPCCRHSILCMACEICSHVTPCYFSMVVILKILFSLRCYIF